MVQNLGIIEGDMKEIQWNQSDETRKVLTKVKAFKETA